MKYPNSAPCRSRLLLLALLGLPALAGAPATADDLNAAAVLRARQSAAANTTGNVQLTVAAPTVLQAQQAQQTQQAQQAQQASAAGQPAAGSSTPQPLGIKLNTPLPTLGTTPTSSDGTRTAIDKTTVSVTPIKLLAPADRTQVRLNLPPTDGQGAATGTTTGMAISGQAPMPTAPAGQSASATPSMTTAMATATQQPALTDGYTEHPQETPVATEHRTNGGGPAHCPICTQQTGHSSADDALARGMRRSAEDQATRLLQDRPRTRVHGYVVGRSQDDELAAQGAAISRMRGNSQVQGLSIRNWVEFQIKNDTRRASGQTAAPVAARPAGNAGATGVALAAADPCNPPPPIVPNPEFGQATQERDALLEQARAKAAEHAAASTRYRSLIGGGDTAAMGAAYDEQTRIGSDLARLEHEIQQLEAKLFSLNAFLDPCNRDSTVDRNNAARAALELPGRPQSSVEAEAMQIRQDQFASQVSSGAQAPGQAYYENWIEGKRDWYSLTDREKRQWADAEKRLLRDREDRLLKDWRQRADAEDDRARAAAQAARQAQSQARYQADQQAALDADAAAAAKRKSQQQRAARQASLAALDGHAKLLNDRLRTALASGDRAMQHQLQLQLDAISQHMLTQGLPDASEQARIAAADQRRMADLDQQRAAASKADAADERQACIDRKRDLEQQNRGFFTRLVNLSGGFFTAGGKSCVEVVQTGLDGVSMGLSAADIANPGPNRSALGRLWSDSKGPGDFCGKVLRGLAGMFTGAWAHLTEGDARGFGEDLFNIGSLAAGPAKVLPKPGAAARNASQAAAASPAALARGSLWINMDAFRRLTPAEQARALAGQGEPVRTTVLQQLKPAERSAFIRADGARVLAEAPRGLYRSPGGVATILTKDGARRIVDDSYVGLSNFDDLPPPGAYSADMTQPMIDALLAKTGPKTAAELLAIADLIYSKRAPRKSMDPDVARALFPIMKAHFRHALKRDPLDGELARLMVDMSDSTVLPPVSAVEAPFGHGPGGTIAGAPLPRGDVPGWLAQQGVDGSALPPALRQSPLPFQPKPRSDISSMGTVHD